MILYGFWRGGSSCLSLLFTGDLAGHCSALWLVSNCLCITCDIYSHIHISIILYIHMTIILFLFYTLENRFFSTHKFYLVGCFCYVLFCFDLILSPIPLGRVSKRLCGIQPPAGLNQNRSILHISFTPVFWICCKKVLHCTKMQNDFKILIIPPDAANSFPFKLKGHFKAKELEYLL